MKNLYILLFIGQSLLAQVVINEYSAANYSDYTDNYSDYEDWFELFNSGDSPQELSGYFLSDKPNNLTKFQISNSLQLNVNSHIRIFASGRDEEIGSDIHTNFKIHQTKGNEWIILTAPDGISIIDSLKVKPCLTNHSRGRQIDGQDSWGVFINPSPFAQNGIALERYAAKPQFDIAPGFYPAAISVELSNTEPNSSTYYTTDGSYPTSGSILYNSAININTSSIIKAITIVIPIQFMRAS